MGFFKLSETRNNRLYVNYILAKSMIVNGISGFVTCFPGGFIRDVQKNKMNLAWTIFCCFIYKKRRTCMNVICFKYRTQKFEVYVGVFFFFLKIVLVNILALAQFVSISSHLSSWVNKIRMHRSILLRSQKQLSCT